MADDLEGSDLCLGPKRRPPRLSGDLRRLQKHLPLFHACGCVKESPKALDGGHVAQHVGVGRCRRPVFVHLVQALRRRSARVRLGREQPSLFEHGRDELCAARSGNRGRVCEHRVARKRTRAEEALSRGLPWVDDRPRHTRVAKRLSHYRLGKAEHGLFLLPRAAELEVGVSCQVRTSSLVLHTFTGWIRC